MLTGGTSPVGGPASATATASIGGSSALPAPPLTAGQTFSNGVLFPAGGLAGAGAMSAAYGGAGESLTYTVSADFTFTDPLTGDLTFDFLTSTSSGSGFDLPQVNVTAPGINEDFDFGTLAQAEAFFNDNPIDLGSFGSGGGAFVDLTMTLSASEVGADFGFTYDFSTQGVTPPPAVAEREIARLRKDVGERVAEGLDAFPEPHRGSEGRGFLSR